MFGVPLQTETGKTMKRILTVMAALGFAVSSLGLAAETVYKWRDKSGAVHFSDQPVHDADAEELRVTPPKPAAGALFEESGGAAADEDPATTGQSTDDRQANVEQQRKKIREQNCQIARQTLQHNESVGRMYRVGADGERVFLSDEESEIVRNTSREDVKKWCD